MPWIFRVKAGELVDPDGVVRASVYAGHGAARNNPDLEGQHGKHDASGKILAGGPLPRGTYKLDLLKVDGDHMGPYAIHLMPDPETKEKILDLHRDALSFYIHGDNATHDASEGCLIVPRTLRGEMWQSPDHELRVT